MKKKTDYLAKAITLSLALGICASVVLPGSVGAAGANDQRVITLDKFANVILFENGELQGYKLRTMSKKELDSFEQGMLYWQAVLGNPKTSTLPLIYFAAQDKDGIDARATSDAVGNVTKLAQYFINENYKGTEEAATILTENGKLNGHNWYYDRLPVLPVNGNNSDYAGTILHEMFHALGIDSKTPGKLETKISVNKTGLTKYSAGLRDINGRKLTDCSTIQLVASKEAGAQTPANTFCILQDNWGGAYYTSKNVEDVLGKDASGKVNTISWPDGGKTTDGKITLEAVPGIPINSYENGTNGPVAELSHFELQNSLQSHQMYRNWCIPMEVELAVLQDLGYKFDRSKFYGRSIYGDMNMLTNKTGYDQSQAWGIGLHVYGCFNDITQSANIKASGAEALGMRIDGCNNIITVANGTTVAANGKNGRAIAFTYGMGHELTIAKGATVTANGAGGIALSFDFGSNELGNFIETRGSYIHTVNGVAMDDLAKLQLDGSLVDKVDINGTVTATGTGGKAIYISDNAYVQTINVNAGSTLKGDIIDDWTDTSHMTTLNFNTGTSYTGGNIQTSAGGTISTMTINYTNGTTNMTSNNQANPVMLLAAANNNAADNTVYIKVNQVNIAKNATVNGGNFDGVTKLNNDGTLITDNLTVAENSTVSGTGVFKVGDMENNGTLVASAGQNGSAGMTITGNLKTNDGSSIVYVGSKQGVAQIKVTGEASGTAKLELAGGYYNLGRDIKVQDIIDDDNATTSINFTNADAVLYGDEGDDDDYISLLDVKYVNDEINGDYLDVFIDQEEVDDVKKMVSPKAARTLQAIVNSDAVINYVEDDDDEAKFADDDDYDDRYDELFNLDYGTTQELQIALEDLADNQVAANSAILPQQSTMLGRMIKGRLADVQGKAVTVPVKVTPKALATNKDAEKQAVVTNVQLSVPYDDGVWVQVDKEWGNVGSANMHSTGYAVGYDKRYNANNQAGVIFGFAQTNVGGWKANDEVADYRLGIYNGYKKGAVDFTVYGDFGWVNHDTKRSTIAILDETAKAKYSGKLLEIGAEYKYDLQDGQEKIFHVAPYVGARFNHYWQGAYAEDGNFGVEMHDFSNNYFDTEVGVEFARKLTQGSYNWRVGYKHVWSGAEPSIYFNYVRAEDTPFSSTATADKNFLTTQFKANMPIDERWELEGEANLQLGAHDKFYGVSAMFKYQF